MKISKELLREVLGVNPALIDYNKQTKELELRDLNIDGECVGGGTINIYELAHKCKEWAYASIKLNSAENDYYVYSIFTFAGEGFCYLTHENNISKRLITFEANTEPEAIFKACQWILENKDK